MAIKKQTIRKDQLLDHDTRSGLELEYEDISEGETVDAFQAMRDKGSLKRPLLWRVWHDGSLRPRDRNTELMFVKGLSGLNVMRALRQLELLRGVRYKTSWRCGMHVHTDYSGLTNDVPYRALIISSIIEPAMFRLWGNGRSESKFCAPSRTVAEFVLKNNDFRPRKYTAFNLAPLQKLGTCELRIADTTRSLEVMLDYINMGTELRRLALGADSGWSILTDMSKHKDMGSWIESKLHPSLARKLAPLARKHPEEMNWKTGFLTATRMAKMEEKLQRNVI